MVTKNGAIQTVEFLRYGAFAERRKKIKFICLIALISGATGLAAYIGLAAFLVDENQPEPLWIKSLLVFAIPFAIGLIGYITIKKLSKAIERENETAYCLFYSNCFFYCTRCGSNVFSDKYEYIDAVLMKAYKGYEYLYAYKKAVCLPFSKVDLTQAELNTIYKLFRRNIKGDGIELNKYAEGDSIK